MYSKSNSSVIIEPTMMRDNAEILKSAITYFIDGVRCKINEGSGLKRSIDATTVGYTCEEYSQLESMYVMAFDNINSLKKSYVAANNALDEIAKLDSNWNDNNAQIFSDKLVKKCRKILEQLVAEPLIYPTACGAIQFEYEKKNNEYLEFEIYEDRIEVYRDTLSDGEEEFTLQGITSVDKMKQMVVDFYG